jgi:hypothetical protein
MRSYPQAFPTFFHKIGCVMDIKFGKRTIGLNHPAYFIADIAANHDGDMERAFGYGLKYPDSFHNTYLSVIGRQLRSYATSNLQIAAQSL